ncbi:hypothetical protein [Chitinophaga nivalis]|uniref:YD repeat-containing protein n=1 Tax=Chitinophaga nivalis TaxID=2991709 RepID=A0ABT3IQZ6_9BACT|nr:hypothetical protein [Chitinophaga nivalis]MCW3463916.1 hypothetical protein [Chitinophaga nivalis]MCW3486394.1 hypothetical protein [Chitinophaga nivalis]
MQNNYLPQKICLLFFISLASLFMACDKTANPQPISGAASGAAKAPIWLLKKAVSTGKYNNFEKIFFYNAQHQLIRSEKKPADSSSLPGGSYYFTYNSNGLLSSYYSSPDRWDSVSLQYDAQNRLVTHSTLRSLNLYYFNYYAKNSNIIGTTFSRINIILFGKSVSFRKEYVYDAIGNVTKVLTTSKSALFPGLPAPPPPDTSLIPTTTLLTYDDHPNFLRSLQLTGPGFFEQDIVLSESILFPVLSTNNITADDTYYYRYIYNKDNLVQQVNVYHKSGNVFSRSIRFEYIRI